MYAKPPAPYSKYAKNKPPLSFPGDADRVQPCHKKFCPPQHLDDDASTDSGSPTTGHGSPDSMLSDGISQPFETACLSPLSKKLIGYSVVNTFVNIEEPKEVNATRRTRSAPPSAPRHSLKLCVPQSPHGWTKMQKTQKEEVEVKGTSRTKMQKTQKEASTVMVRNLPNRATIGRMQAHLTELNCHMYESIYMPLDNRTGMNKGYAFIHFNTIEEAQIFTDKVEGTKLRSSQTSKRLTASVASYQGAATKPTRMGQDMASARGYSSRVWTK